MEKECDCGEKSEYWCALDGVEFYCEECFETHYSSVKGKKGFVWGYLNGYEECEGCGVHVYDFPYRPLNCGVWFCSLDCCSNFLKKKGMHATLTKLEKSKLEDYLTEKRELKKRYCEKKKAIQTEYANLLVMLGK